MTGFGLPCPAQRRPARLSAAFTSLELLLAAAIASAVLTVAVLTFQAITARSRNYSSIERVYVGAPRLQNFYGTGTDFLDGVYTAPNFARSAQAALVREAFLDDLEKASAVFCLGRDGLNTNRPSTLPTTGFAGLATTPEIFRQSLANAAAFVPYTTTSTAASASIFILGPGLSTGTVSVVAIYEIDLVPLALPAGTYVSVRRYVNGTLDGVNFYDVFYPQDPGAPPFTFSPLITYAPASGNRPAFYYLCWPDPAEPPATAAYATNLRSRTPFFFVVPAFPALHL